MSDIETVVLHDDIVFSGARGTRCCTIHYSTKWGVLLTNERLERTYKPAGPVLAPMFRVYAVGDTPELALEALGKKIGWGRLSFEETPEYDHLGAWFLRFHADGTSMKASGFRLPGGCIVDWWK